jgi:hypothetical protein
MLPLLIILRGPFWEVISKLGGYILEVKTSPSINPSENWSV